MKKFLQFFVLFIISLCSYCQQDSIKYNYELLGALILDSQEFMSFKVQFNKTNGNKIEGYSYTDMGGENETKSYIRGNYDVDTKKIAFRESDILYTKSEFLPEEFCFVDFKGKFKENQKKKILQGDFYGIYSQKDTCATGKLKLISTKFLEKKLIKLNKKLDKVEKIKKIDSTVRKGLNTESYLKKFSETKIASGEKVNVFVYTNRLKVEIWDYGKEDGDEISLFNNDFQILKKYLVKKRKKIIYLDLHEKENLLKLITENAGTLKTNTTKIILYDYRREYEVIADLEVGKAAFINVVKLSRKKI